MMRILVWIFYGYLLLKLVKFLTKLLLQKPDRDNQSDAVGQDLVQDPVCGVYVLRSRAIVKNSKGQVNYFCSKDCLNKYVDEE